MSYGFYLDAAKKSDRRIRQWYQNNIMQVLQSQKEKQVREIDVSIALAKQLLDLLNEPAAKPIPVPSHDLEPQEDDSMMKPVEPEVEDLLYMSTEKGSTEVYLKARNKKSPEDKYFFRITSNWDYGWQQKKSRTPSRDVNRGRCAILRETFYRKNNLAPDLPHYAQPVGAECSVCSEYSCNFG